MRTVCAANAASFGNIGLPAACPGYWASPYQRAGTAIKPDLNVAAAGGAGYPGLEACGIVTEIEIVEYNPIPILDIADIQPAFAAGFSRNP